MSERKYMTYTCRKGLEVVSSENLPIPPKETELIVVDKRIGYVFDEQCLKCEYGRWKNGVKYCTFKLKKND